MEKMLAIRKLLDAGARYRKFIKRRECIARPEYIVYETYPESGGPMALVAKNGRRRV
jgi:hypothetical protein